MAFFDLQIPFFKPVWRRVALIGVCLGWAFFEFLNEAALWGFLFLALAVLAAWQFFFDGWPDTESSSKD